MFKHEEFIKFIFHSHELSMFSHDLSMSSHEHFMNLHPPLISLGSRTQRQRDEGEHYEAGPEAGPDCV